MSDLLKRMQRRQPGGVKQKRPILVGEAPSRVVRGAKLTDGVSRYDVIDTMRDKPGSRLYVKLRNEDPEFHHNEQVYPIEDILELGIVR